VITYEPEFTKLVAKLAVIEVCANEADVTDPAKNEAVAALVANDAEVADAAVVAVEALPFKDPLIVLILSVPVLGL
jgi:hypothetical protein